MKIKELLKKYLPAALIRQRLGKDAAGSILLTFDDGPCAETTPQVLDILDRYQVKAAFFVVGNRIEKSPEILRMIAERGHLVGNHSYHHSPRPLVNPFRIFDDLRKCAALIKGCGIEDHRIYRPPCGRLSPLTFFVAKILGYRIVFWSVEGQDWNCRSEVEAANISQKILNEISGRDIVLLHDDNRYVLKILEKLLPALIERGFLFSASIS